MMIRQAKSVEVLCRLDPLSHAVASIYLSPGLFGFNQIGAYAYFRTSKRRCCAASPTPGARLVCTWSRRRPPHRFAVARSPCSPRSCAPRSRRPHSPARPLDRWARRSAGGLQDEHARRSRACRRCAAGCVGDHHEHAALRNAACELLRHRVRAAPLVRPVGAHGDRAEVRGSASGASPRRWWPRSGASIAPSAWRSSCSIGITETIVRAARRCLEPRSALLPRRTARRSGRSSSSRPSRWTSSRLSVEDNPDVVYQSTASYAPPPGVRHWARSLASPWTSPSATIFTTLYQLTAMQHRMYPCEPASTDWNRSSSTGWAKCRLP